MNLFLRHFFDFVNFLCYKFLVFRLANMLTRWKDSSGGKFASMRLRKSRYS